MTFNLTTAGFVIPSVTGSISCISSLAIIYIIVRSKSNTIYTMSFCHTFLHRVLVIRRLVYH